VKKLSPEEHEPASLRFFDNPFPLSSSSYYHAVELCFFNTIRLFGEISQRERSRARQQAEI